MMRKCEMNACHKDRSILSHKILIFGNLITIKYFVAQIYYGGKFRKSGKMMMLISIDQQILLIIMSQRKQALKGKESSGTPTKVANPSPSRQPIRSPLTASKFNASNSKPNVSYGELQIVLENIQEIRKKANQQISVLTEDNQRLKEELARSQMDFEELSSRLNKSSSKNEFQMKVIEQLDSLESDKKMLEVELKESTRRIKELEDKNRGLQRTALEKEDIISKLEKNIEEWNKKWKWAFDILAGDESRSEELIWKVKNQCSEGIWGIFEENFSFNQQLQLKTGSLDVVERELGELKQYSKQTTSLLEKNMFEVTSLNQKLSQCEQELAISRERCQTTENQLKQTQKEYQNAVYILEQKLSVANKQTQISLHDLNEKVARLEEQIQQRNHQMEEKQRHEQYEALVSQICEESQDYSQLLERLRYLEKFKAEHYFNVEKIQYLCKMLDY